MMNTYDWQGAGTVLPDGTRAIEAHDGPGDISGWALFDRGLKPAEVEPASIVWLDRERSLNASTSHSPTVPLKDNDGDVVASHRTDAPTLLALARMLRWTIADEVRGSYYSVS